ncbi:hypothetical protein Rhe02_95980 [Rhizocola hellebori]|uniref:Uncharacterized protein n=1 Tax=Rhizocola hellebori TaxID=1392758 RepID=A0A8J3VMP0_9ACTN|nr:hypothetical protein Rhe02_95980 [Rhizocola hellebori]
MATFHLFASAAAPPPKPSPNTSTARHAPPEGGSNKPASRLRPDQMLAAPVSGKGQGAHPLPDQRTVCLMYG